MTVFGMVAWLLNSIQLLAYFIKYALIFWKQLPIISNYVRLYLYYLLYVLNIVRLWHTLIFLCCDIRYDFRMKTTFGSSLPPVVCRRAHVLLRYSCLLAHSGVQRILYCDFASFIFVLCTLCCQFLLSFRLWRILYV
jgi:hypothetical protein